MRNLKAVVLLLGALSLLLLVVACSGGDEEETGTASAAAVAPAAEAPVVTKEEKAPSAAAAAQFEMEPESGMPQYGGTLRLTAGDDPRSLNFLDNVSASTGSTLQGVYDRLVNWKWEGGSNTWKEIAPGIAASWKVSDNGLTWTFKLREDVTFHNGAPLTSHDVKATYDHYVGAAKKTIDRRPPAKSYVGPFVDSVDAPDDYTVVLNLNAPAAVLLQNLSAGWANIVSKKDLDAHGVDWFIDNVNGTGPFKWMPDEWERGVGFKLERNENYWEDGLPYLDGKEYTVISSRSLIQAAFETGNIDVISGPSTGELASITAKFGDKVKLIEGPGGSPAWAMLNTRVEPFNDEKVRQAVYLYLNRDEIKERALQGAPGYLGSWFETNTFAGGYGTSLDELRKKDIAYALDKTAARQKAKEILSAAGYNDLSKYKIDVISRGTSATAATFLGSQVIASQLQEMGFDVEFKALESLAAVEALKKGTGWHATMYTSSLPYPAPEAMLNRYLSNSGQRNYSGLEDPIIDPLVKQITGATNETDRRARLTELEEYLSTGKNAMYFIYYSGVQFLEHDYVHGRRFVSSWFAQYDNRTWVDQNSPSRN